MTSAKQRAHAKTFSQESYAGRQVEYDCYRPTESWWIASAAASREAFQQRALVEAARMARSKKFSNVKWTAS